MARTLRLVLGTTLVVGLGAVSPATGSPERTAANSVTYVDERGEDAGSPDIRSVVVSNDDTGLITLRVNIPSHPTMPDDMRIQVSLSDGDAATGMDRGGTDAVIYVDPISLGPGGAQFLGCSGSVCGGADTSLYAYKPTLFRYSYASGIARFTMDLGIPVTPRGATRLDFRVNASAGWAYDPAKGFDSTNVHRDAIPARYDEFLTYTVQIGPSPRLVAKSLTTTPAIPRAGESLTVRLEARAADGAALLSGNVTCGARIAAAPVRPLSQGFAKRRAVCVFDIAKNAHGKTIRGWVSVDHAGKTARLPFVRRIR